jgi:hypothetical protein
MTFETGATCNHRQPASTEKTKSHSLPGLENQIFLGSYG